MSKARLNFPTNLKNKALIKKSDYEIGMHIYLLHYKAEEILYIINYS